MLSSGRGTICIVKQTFPGSDVHSLYTDPAKQIMPADTGCTIDDLDRDLSEVRAIASRVRDPVSPSETDFKLFRWLTGTMFGEYCETKEHTQVSKSLHTTHRTRYRSSTPSVSHISRDDMLSRICIAQIQPKK